MAVAVWLNKANICQGAALCQTLITDLIILLALFNTCRSNVEDCRFTPI